MNFMMFRRQDAATQSLINYLRTKIEFYEVFMTPEQLRQAKAAVELDIEIEGNDAGREEENRIARERATP